MKLTKEQIIKIIQEETVVVPAKGHGNVSQIRKSHGYCRYVCVELAQFYNPHNANSIPAFNGYGKILNEAAHRYRESIIPNFLAFLFQLTPPSGRCYK